MLCSIPLRPRVFTKRITDARNGLRLGAGRICRRVPWGEALHHAVMSGEPAFVSKARRGLIPPFTVWGGYRVLRGSPQFEIDDCYSVDHLSVLAIFLGSTDSTKPQRSLILFAYGNLCSVVDVGADHLSMDWITLCSSLWNKHDGLLSPLSFLLLRRSWRGDPWPNTHELECSCGLLC